LGWIIGRNLQLDHRWGPLDRDSLRRAAQELVALAPEVMIVAGGSAGEAVQQASRLVALKRLLKSMVRKYRSVWKKFTPPTWSTHRTTGPYTGVIRRAILTPVLPHLTMLPRATPPRAELAAI
jgi:hypothetical protein